MGKTKGEDMMKKYWVFVGESYYSGGGVSDLTGRFEKLIDAERSVCDVEFHEKYGCNWYQIVNVELGEVVRYCDCLIEEEHDLVVNCEEDTGDNCLFIKKEI